jgi:hypothetical protein
MSHFRLNRRMKRSNDGHIYERNRAFHCRYYGPINGHRVQKSKRLIDKTGRITARSGEVRDACKAFMLTAIDQVALEPPPVEG